MGYRIDYQPVRKLRNKEITHIGVISIACIFCVLCFYLILFFWPEGNAAILQWLLPGDETVTAAAIENMLFALKNGDPVMDSLEAFCRHIWEGAAIAAY